MEGFYTELKSMIRELDPDICMLNRNIYENCNEAAKKYIMRYNPNIYKYLLGETAIDKYKHLTSILRYTNYSEQYKSKLALARLMLNKSISYPRWNIIANMIDDYFIKLDPDLIPYTELINTDKFFYTMALTVNYFNLELIKRIYTRLTSIKIWSDHMILLGLVRRSIDKGKSSFWYRDIYRDITQERPRIVVTPDLIADLLIMNDPLSNEFAKELLSMYPPQLTIESYRILSETSYDDPKTLSFKLRNKRFTNLDLFKKELWQNNNVIRYIDLLDDDLFMAIKDYVPYQKWLIKAADSGNINRFVKVMKTLNAQQRKIFRDALDMIGHNDFVTILQTR